MIFSELSQYKAVKFSEPNKKERRKLMEDSIKELAEYISLDIEEMRNSDLKAIERLGAEVMALNALCNAEKTLKNKE